MNKKDARKYEKLLESELERLSQGIRRLQQDTLYQPSSETSSADPASFAEVGTDNFEREKELKVASGESAMLQDVADALARIQNGTYGQCESCSAPINRKRLEFFPSARYCIECQSKLERDGYL